MVPPAAASQDRILSALREFGMPLVTELRA
jgi:hypothetical protein